MGSVCTGTYAQDTQATRFIPPERVASSPSGSDGIKHGTTGEQFSPGREARSGISASAQAPSSGESLKNVWGTAVRDNLRSNSLSQPQWSASGAAEAPRNTNSFMQNMSSMLSTMNDQVARMSSMTEMHRQLAQLENQMSREAKGHFQPMLSQIKGLMQQQCQMMQLQMQSQMDVLRKQMEGMGQNNNTNGTNNNTNGVNNNTNGLNNNTNNINPGTTRNVTPDNSVPRPGENNPQPFPYKDGAKITIPGTEGAIRDFRIGVIGDPNNIKKIYFVNHGDGNSDYFNSTRSDREAMAKHLPQGEGAVVAYPISPASQQSTFANGKNGEALINAYRHLEKLTGNRDVKFEQFSLSGGGRANNALLQHINEKYHSDPGVKEFVDNHLRGVHDGDSLCRDIPQMKKNFKEAIKNFPNVKFSFIHNTSGYMSYVQGQQNEIASYVKNNYQDKTSGSGQVTPDKVYNYGGSWSSEDGRIRFWAAPTHWKSWATQFEKVFFG